MQPSAAYQSLPQRSRHRRKRDAEGEQAAAADGQQPQKRSPNADGIRTESEANEAQYVRLDEASAATVTAGVKQAEQEVQPSTSGRNDAPAYRSAAEGTDCFECTVAEAWMFVDLREDRDV